MNSPGGSQKGGTSRAPKSLSHARVIEASESTGKLGNDKTLKVIQGKKNKLLDRRERIGGHCEFSECISHSQS
jgi:hypothetical protein